MSGAERERAEGTAGWWRVVSDPGEREGEQPRLVAGVLCLMSH